MRRTIVPRFVLRCVPRAKRRSFGPSHAAHAAHTLRVVQPTSSFASRQRAGPFPTRTFSPSPPSSSSSSSRGIGSVRHLAVKINVGHGPAYTASQAARFVAENLDGKSPPTATSARGSPNERIKPRATAEQQRGARLELERMVRSTQNLLIMARADDGDSGGKNLTSSPALQNELRVALHYWTTRWYAHHHPTLTATPTVDSMDETGAKNAERLLDRIGALSQSDGDGNLVDKVLGVDGNAALTNLMDSYLLPCSSSDASSDQVASISTSTSTSTASSRSSNTSKSVDVIVWSNAIKNALRVHEKMYRLFKDDTNSLGEDTLVWNSTLNVLSKLCVVLSHGHKLDEGTRAELTDALNSSAGDMVGTEELRPIASNELTVDNVIRIMETMLHGAVRRYYDDGDVALMPDVCTYNTVIGTIARYHATRTDGLERIERYVQRMEMAEQGEPNVGGEDEVEKRPTSSSHQYPATCPPDVVTYNSLLYVHSSLAARPFPGEKGNAASLAASHSKDAAAVLGAMEERYSRTQRPEVQPDTISYATVLHSYANVGNAKEAQRILDHMESLSQTNEWKDRVRPNTICFNSTLHALSKSKENDAPHRAEALLRRMERLAETRPELGIRPDTVSYSAVISTWARSNAKDGAERAEELLRRTLRDYEEGKNDHAKPDIITHNTVLDAWAKQSARLRGRSALEAAERAESLVAEMENGGAIKPCTISYNILIDAWSKSRCKGSAEKAEAILRRMPQPDEISWNNVLAAYANSGRDDGLVSALRLLKEMEEGDDVAVRPSTISYNLIMDAMTHRGTIESAEKAEKLLHKMEAQFEAGNTTVKPSGVSYNIVINGYAKSGSPDAGDKAQALLKRMASQAQRWGSAELSPDSVSYTSVIDSFANSGQRDAADRAQNLLNTMHAESGIAPSRVTFNSVMNAVAKSGAPGSAQRAEAILKQMEDLYQAGNSDVKPDDISYSTVLNAWARSGEIDAADRAEAILHKLEEAGMQDSGVRPNAYSYSSVLNALARSKDPTAPDRALALLNRMDDMCQGGNRDCRPNSFCYNSVINAFAKSRDDAKAIKSYQLLRRMLDEYESGRNPDAKPSVMTYSTVLNSCAYTRGDDMNRREAFQIARACFRDVLSLGGANSSVPFSMFLLTCARLAPRGDERDVLVESVFKECCRRGVVDELVIKNLRNAAPPALLSKLLGTAGREVDHTQLPQEWKCNLEKRRRYRN